MVCAQDVFAHTHKHTNFFYSLTVWYYCVAHTHTLTHPYTPSPPHTQVLGDGYTIRDDGLIYRDFVVGSGEYPAEGQEVTFDYTAYNESGAYTHAGGECRCVQGEGSVRVCESVCVSVCVCVCNCVWSVLCFLSCYVCTVQECIHQLCYAYTHTQGRA